MPDKAPEVKREVTLHATRTEVWELLTEPRLAEQWLADEVELDAREGGEAVFRDEGGEERRGHVEEVDPEERLHIRWRRGTSDPSDVVFVLADAAAGTRLTVIESAPALRTVAAHRVWEDRTFRLELAALVRGAAPLLAA